MRIEVRLKPKDAYEKSTAHLIESALSIQERTITTPGEHFWIFDSVSRARNVLNSLYEIIKIRPPQKGKSE